MFSYPPSLQMVEGYTGHTSLAEAKTWAGGEFSQELTFKKVETSQESTQTVNKPGAITKALSFIDNIFGSDLANVPADSFSSFTRSVSDHDSLSVNIPTGYSQHAGFTTEFEP